MNSFIMVSFLTTTLLPLLFSFNVLSCTVLSVDLSTYFTRSVKDTLSPTQWMVNKENTLKSISYSLYGSTEYWEQIWNDNTWIENPDTLSEGTIVSVKRRPLVKKEELTPQLKEQYALLHPTHTSIVVNYSPLPTPPSNFDEVYKKAGEQYGVPWQILYGLHLTESGLRDGAITSGYGTGAQGPMQFMPGTFNAYAVDGNGDGVTDINNAQDAIHTAANYLAKHGSLENGLASYGGNTPGTLQAARERGYGQ